MTRLLIIDHNAYRRSGRTLYNAIHTAGIAEVAIVAPRIWTDYGTTRIFEKSHDGPEVLPLDVVFGGRHHRVLYRRLDTILRSFNPDIVLCNAEPENFLASQIVHARKKLRATFRIALITWRNVDYRMIGYPYKLSSLHKWIEHQVLASVDAIVAHTSNARPIYERYGFERVTAIPPSVDCSLYAPTSPSGVVSRMSCTIGFAGRFTELKGGDLLLRALVSLPALCELHMIGGGEQEARWRALAQEIGVSERVHWHGAVPHDQMPSQLRDLDILVLPSRTGRYWREQFGRVLIEAMASGVVVVGSSSGEIPAVLQGAGEIFQEGDARELSAVLGSLVADPSRRTRLSRLGLTRVRSTFSIEAVLPLYQTLFDRLKGSIE